MRSGGRSMIVDPWGVVLAQAPDARDVVVADLDLDAPGTRSARTLPVARQPPPGPTWPEEVHA